MRKRNNAETVNAVRGASADLIRRRKFLNGVVIVGSTSLTSADHWVSPVISSVVLPVHARTSGENNCASLVVPGIAFSCSQPLSESDSYYQIDDSGVCPELVSVTAQSNQRTLRIVMSVESNTTENYFLRITVGNNSQREFNLLDCPDDAISGVLGMFSDTVDALSGVVWKVDYAVTSPGPETDIVLSDLSLSPA